MVPMVITIGVLVIVIIIIAYIYTQCVAYKVPNAALSTVPIL